MIYTVTFNPAIDCVIYTDELRTGGTNRSRREEIFIGGKGINVSIILRELGISSRALGFVAGFTGTEIEKHLAAVGIDTDFVRLESGFSRINVKIKSSAETEINGSGPDIPESALNELLIKLNSVRNGDTIVLAGSVQPSLSEEIYGKILETTADRKIRAVVDATGSLLLNTLKYKPFLVKPNIAELAGLFGVELRGIDDVIKYAGKLREMGAVNVLVSMAGDGAVLLDEYGKTHVCGACRGKVRNSVGAGDSMVGGFIAGCEKGYEYALRLGTAAGGATAFSEGLAEKSAIYELLNQI